MIFRKQQRVLRIFGRWHRVHNVGAINQQRCNGDATPLIDGATSC
jgi:hypothetical protein